MEGFYLDISVYGPLVGGTYIELPNKLKHPMKRLINIQNNDNKCFLWCHVYIKDFTRFMFNKTKNKVKKYFCKNCLQCFSSEEILIEHKKDCLSIIGKQSVKLESGFIHFKNYFKQILVPFKIYADFECILKKVGIDVEYDSNSSYTRKYQNHIPCTFACKVAFVDNKYCKEIVLYRGKDVAFKFIKSILNEYNYCKSVVKKHFNKNLIMSAGENERFEMTNIVGFVVNCLRIVIIK